MGICNFFGKIIFLTGFLLIISGTTVYAQNVAYITENSVNVRADSSTEAEIIDKYDAGQVVTLIGYNGDWAKIAHSSGREAYVFGQYVMLDETFGTVSVDRLNVREKPTTDSTVLGQLQTGNKIKVTGAGTNWFAVEYENSTAYIYADYIVGEYLDVVKKVSLVETPAQKSNESLYAVVTSSTGLRLRENPSTESRILFTMPYSDVMDVIENQGEWTKVAIDDLVGYVSTQYIEVKIGEKPTRTGYTSKGLELVAYAKQCLGNRYVWGGTSLVTGADCSGYVYSLMKKIGVTVNRTSREQAKNGKGISKSELQPGDLVFFGSSSYINHVGIYIGNGEFIHSAGEKYGVIISKLSARKDYVTARRVIY